jgi:alpha-galactosidase/6-phospho-beta-glucosidase family protein
MVRSHRTARQQWANVKIAVIGGGALGWTPSIVTDLALNKHLGGRIVLFDIDSVPLAVMKRYCQAIVSHRDSGGRFRVTATQDRREALRGADFVVITISVGGLAMMDHDLRIPRRYGIIQSVGDTVGPGGLFRGLRNVPVFKRLADDILRHCPGAWVINYTNPMTVLTRTLTSHGVRAIGCCHEVFGAQELIAGLANRVLGRRDLRRRDVDLVVTGLNHCTVITRAAVAGHDALEMIRRYAKRPGVVRKYAPGELQRAKGIFARHQVKLEFLRRYGVLAASGDRHTVEFFPAYLTPRTFEGQRWGVVATTIEERIKWKQDDLARCESRVRDLPGLARRRLKPSGEEASDLLGCLVGATSMKTNVNRPNIGQVSNLPADVVVETNAWLTYDRVEPICSGPLPAGLLPCYLRHVANQESTIRAALTGDRDLALRVLLNDPLVADCDDAEKMFKELLAAEADYLPNFFRGRKVRVPRRDTSKLAAIHGALAAGLRYG